MTYISLHYKIITSIYDPPSYTYQCSNFSSMIKNKIDSWAFIYLNNFGHINKFELKQQISKNSCIPYETIVDIYLYSKIYVDEHKNYTKAFNLENKRYSHKGDNNIYYAYVDLYKDTVFWNINNARREEENNKKYLENRVSALNSTISNLSKKNRVSNNKISSLKSENQKLRENQENIKRELTEKNDALQRNFNNLENKYNDLQYNHETEIKNLNNENRNLRLRIEEEKNQMNRKNQRLEQNIHSLEYQNRNIRVQYENLKTENQTRKNELNNLTVEHNNLKRKQQEEENKKIEKRKNFENFKTNFNKDKEVIKNNNIQISKSFITTFIINEFAKGFENRVDKDNFTKSLTNYMSKFTEEFMSYCKPFIKSFKNHSQKIISEYKVNESKLNIEHINFIVT